MHRPVTLVKQEAKPQAGEIDAFELASFPVPERDRGRKVRCTSARSLLYYAASRSARKARVIEHVEGVSVRLQIEGPITHDQNPLRAVYTVGRAELLSLTEEEQAHLEKCLDVLYDGVAHAPASPARRLREISTS